MKKPILTTVLTLILIGTYLAVGIRIPKAYGTVYIKPDGSIDPPTANITQNGYTYTLIGNIYDSLVIQKNDIVLDGANFFIQGSMVTGSKGIDLSGRSNVTVKNVKVKAFEYGVFLSASSKINITGCTITDNSYGVSLSDVSNYNRIVGNVFSANVYYGVYFEFSSNNTIEENNITANSIEGLKLFAGSSNNSIVGNNITANGNNGLYIRASPNNILRNNRMVGNKYNFYFDGSSLTDFVQDIDTSNTVENKPVYYLLNKKDISVPADAGYVCLANCTNITVQNLELTKNGQGILLAFTADSTIAKNNITANYRGVTVRSSSNNKFYGNNFLNNALQVYLSNSINIWDDGFPSGGNYWSDYAGTDMYSGPTQTEPRKDGIGDFAYYIDSNNRDRYPLMTLYGEKTVRFVPTRYQTIQEAVNAANPKDEVFVYSGLYLETVTVDKTLSLISESKNSTIIDGYGVGDVVSIVNTHDASVKGFIIRNSSLSSGYAGIKIYNSDNCTIMENTIVQNAYGILVTASSYCHIENNNLSLNIYGARFQAGSENGEIFRNIIENNTHYGLNLDSLSNNCLIANNLLKGNEYGLIINGSTSGCTVYQNNFINNIHQVGGNPILTQWNSSYPSGGNYWSDYAGTDMYSGPTQTEPGSDGIGDTPYSVVGDDEDNYPLMHLWTNIAIVALSSHPIIGRGYSVTINVTVENQGFEATVFDVTVYVNTTIIGTKQVSLLYDSSSNVAFVWNTSAYIIGKYNVTAIATLIIGERNTADNAFPNYWVQVTKVGDFGGGLPPRFFQCDGRVDSKDLSLFLQCYKKISSPETWYLADLGSGTPPQFFLCDGKVDSKDLSLFLQCYKGLGP